MEHFNKHKNKNTEIRKSDQKDKLNEVMLL